MIHLLAGLTLLALIAGRFRITHHPASSHQALDLFLIHRFRETGIRTTPKAPLDHKVALVWRFNRFLGQPLFRLVKPLNAGEIQATITLPGVQLEQVTGERAHRNGSLVLDGVVERQPQILCHQIDQEAALVVT